MFISNTIPHRETFLLSVEDEIWSQSTTQDDIDPNGIWSKIEDKPKTHDIEELTNFSFSREPESTNFSLSQGNGILNSEPDTNVDKSDTMVINQYTETRSNPNTKSTSDNTSTLVDKIQMSSSPGNCGFGIHAGPGASPNQNLPSLSTSSSSDASNVLPKGHVVPGPTQMSCSSSSRHGSNTVPFPFNSPLAAALGLTYTVNSGTPCSSIVGRKELSKGPRDETASPDGVEVASMPCTELIDSFSQGDGLLSRGPYTNVDKSDTMVINKSKATSCNSNNKSNSNNTSILVAKTQMPSSSSDCCLALHSGPGASSNQKLPSLSTSSSSDVSNVLPKVHVGTGLTKMSLSSSSQGGLNTMPCILKTTLSEELGLTYIVNSNTSSSSIGCCNELSKGPKGETAPPDAVEVESLPCAGLTEPLNLTRKRKATPVIHKRKRKERTIYECNKCEHIACSKSDSDKHQRLHNPWVCPKIGCKVSYYQKKSVLAHYRKYHIKFEACMKLCWNYFQEPFDLNCADTEAGGTIGVITHGPRHVDVKNPDVKLPIRPCEHGTTTPIWSSMVIPPPTLRVDDHIAVGVETTDTQPSAPNNSDGGGSTTLFTLERTHEPPLLPPARISAAHCIEELAKKPRTPGVVSVMLADQDIDVRGETTKTQLSHSFEELTKSSSIGIIQSTSHDDGETASMADHSKHVKRSRVSPEDVPPSTGTSSKENAIMAYTNVKAMPKLTGDRNPDIVKAILIKKKGHCHKCKKCEYSGRSRVLLQQHQRIHNPWTCPTGCKMTSHIKKNVLKHYRMYHIDYELQNNLCLLTFNVPFAHNDERIVSVT
jgi:hypothetical protein